MWETIVNAVLHRDYSISDDIQILVFDNRIEILSPGKLPGYVNIENILDARLFTRLPPGAAIINAGRGRQLVEADLLAALDSGQLSAAVLDVFREEPLPPAHPFWRHPRIIVTPHVAAETHPPTAAAIIARAIGDLEAGRTVAHLIDRRRGY